MTHAPDWTPDALPVISGVYRAIVLAAVDQVALGYDVDLHPLSHSAQKE